MSSGRMMKYFAASSGWPGRTARRRSRGEELPAGAAGAVHDQHGVAHDALRVLLRRAERAVVQFATAPFTGT